MHLVDMEMGSLKKAGQFRRLPACEDHRDPWEGTPAPAQTCDGKH